ncbi:redoxin domain-containing protein [Pedobacter frigoris]|uniref:redoxin domain-containing protein n=1 Tax=Pedobacter frigoris TaxID=2571272 RepID=UPI002931749A|nr:redoxin domain-containing protein [Pedobacter frigoris]
MKRSSYLILTLILIGALVPKLAVCQNISRVNPAEPNEKTRLLKAIESDPDNLSLHQDYLDLFSAKDTVQLISKYSQLGKKYPKSAVIPFAFGGFLKKVYHIKAKDYFEKALSLRPDWAEVWIKLYETSYLTTSDSIKIGYLKKAMDKAPKNLDYRMRYISALQSVDKMKSDSLYIEVAKRYPDSLQAGQALWELSLYTDNKDIKRAYYNQLFKSKHATTFRGAIFDYFALLINNSEYREALEVSLTMDFKTFTNNTLRWKFYTKVARQFIEAKQLLNEKQPDAALLAFNNIKLKDNFSAVSIGAADHLFLLKAEANDMAGRTSLSYDSVMNYYSRQPSDLFSDIMFKYARKIGKDSNQVYTDVNAIRYKGVKKATPFSLLHYETSKKVALEDFKGKVVLLTYWFPSCGPCRAEFPYFESVLKKFNRDQVAYIGINTTPEEDALVLPYIKDSGCTFIPLKDNPLWDRGNIDWSGAPTNYLIDQEGNVVFSNFRTHKGNERTLELMIAELLNKKAK